VDALKAARSGQVIEVQGWGRSYKRLDKPVLYGHQIVVLTPFFAHSVDLAGIDFGLHWTPLTAKAMVHETLVARVKQKQWWQSDGSTVDFTRSGFGSGNGLDFFRIPAHGQGSNVDIVKKQDWPVTHLVSTHSGLVCANV